MEVDARLTGLPVSHRGDQRAGELADCRLVLMKLDQKDLATKAPEDILTQVTGYSFRAVIPKTNLSVAIHYAHARLQAFQCGAEDFRVLKVQHL
jgi:alpha/beta superfamily hydrolase